MTDNLVPSEQPSLTPHEAEQAQLEAERMHDVFLLLENLFKREEATTKIILDCLYEVGSVNLIDRKLRCRPLNRLVRWIARLSKPAFRMIAMRWVKRNSPRLITDWLHSQVKFEPRKTLQAVIVNPPSASETFSRSSAGSEPVLSSAESAQSTESSLVQTVPLVKLEDYNREIGRLKSQIKVLATLLVGVTVSLGGAIAWSFFKEANLPQPVHHIREAIANPCGGKSIRLIEACD